MSLSKNAIHIVTQAKGGVGKSFISRLLIQYLNKHVKVFGFDADPLNDGLVSFKGINSHKLELKMINDNLDSRAYYDPLFETILLNDYCFVIDSGSSTHINFINYLKSSDILNFFKEKNREIYFHVPLTGNTDFHDCFKELLRLTQLFPNNKFIIWENNFNGELDQSYKLESKFRSILNRPSIVELKNFQASPLLADIELMNKQKMLFSEVEASTTLFGAIAKRRLTIYKDSIYQQLDDVFQQDDIEKA
ncbi:CobQ/CobB/MinD/ParA family nucleotide binding protein [Acinetobacter calcoaceticus]|uniref:CobQ/CobB/MinD/ParA family nucleotide binding protein n=1 Tax=Acinetobacter calcoaceticus TaxID=471 RepID=A0A4R1XBA1_ACICA|nr:CobQ/CobB/MinD/ParA family nucleotide binding protein [Acinetobacter calcoaceticus]